jgi:hypothetical protein
MPAMTKKKYDFKYDFEIGYFIKSPCKKCLQKRDFPKCAEHCDLLDRIHTMLADVISCTRRKDL